ncbi:MAG TPA: DUF4390 domain-containing protein [Steroidobacteraceae bacterium]|jgi:hypothetical protein|nr:DUF4390 domain-containing protein [Steroidobacteraceae bacterium]
MYPGPFRPPWVMLAAAWLALCSAAVLGDALDGVLQVRSAFVDLDHSVFQLHARIDYPMTPAISDALRDGVDLIFDVDARVERTRRFWFDSTVVDLSLRRELAYHTVSDRYVVRDLATGDQHSFATLDAALQELGTVDGWPILVEPQLEAGAQYLISVRAGIHRGHLSSSLRALLFWTDDWSRVSDWYKWSLTT